jgi:hypothetical protein
MTHLTQQMIQNVSRITAIRGLLPAPRMGAGRRAPRGLVAAVLALLLASLCSACGAPRTRATSPGSAAAMLPASLVVDNQSASPVVDVHIRPAASEDWGNGLIGASEPIIEGARYTVEGIPPGVWDVRLSDDGDNQQIFFDIYLAAGAAYELQVTDEDWRPGE